MVVYVSEIMVMRRFNRMMMLKMQHRMNMIQSLPPYVVVTLSSNWPSAVKKEFFRASIYSSTY